MQSSPAQRTKRSTRQAHSQASPFSPVAARLIAQIQAEARAALLAELSAKDSIVVLHPPGQNKRVRFDVDGDLSVTDDRGSVNCWRRRTEPDGWRNSESMQGHWHPAYWFGNMTIKDANGRLWTHHLNRMVIDDFGTLAEVSE